MFSVYSFLSSVTTMRFLSTCNIVGITEEQEKNVSSGMPTSKYTRGGFLRVSTFSSVGSALRAFAFSASSLQHSCMCVCVCVCVWVLLCCGELCAVGASLCPILQRGIPIWTCII